MQSGGKNQDAFADLLERLRDFVERGGEGLDVFALEWSDESFAELLGQFLGDLFVFAPAVDEILQAFRRFMMLELRQQSDQMMHAAVGLLRAGFEQIEKILVVSKKFPDLEHAILLYSVSVKRIYS